MTELITALQSVGENTLELIWLPVFVWTVLAVPIALLLRYLDSIPPVYQYHSRVALLLALPLGLSGSIFTGILGGGSGTAAAATAKFIVIENPISVTANSAASAPGPATLLTDPMLWLGLLNVIFAVGTLFLLSRLLWNGLRLRRFGQQLSFTPLRDITELNGYFPPDQVSNCRNTAVAFSPKVEIPFTYGWPETRIVIPSDLRERSDHCAMAVKHELMHIRHRDFLLNGILLITRALFWFHPVTHRLYNSCRDYREITCDSEVLADNRFSKKRYAALLFELSRRHTAASKFAMSMAVNPSTLKKRIQTMSSQENISVQFRSSFLLTLMTAALVVLSMACTDLQRSDTSGEALIGKEIRLHGSQITINGKELVQFPDTAGPEGPANGVLAMNFDDYGTFLVSGQKFEGAKPAVTVSGDEMSFTVNEMAVEITAANPILNGEEAAMWAAHLPVNGGTAASNGGRMAVRWYSSHEQYLDDRREVDMNVDIETGEKENDFFVAVEEMPELVGGLASLQSRIRYPEEARQAGVEGRVIVQFIINEQGRVENPEIIRGIGAGCDEEALRVVRQAEFKPGKQRGQPVRVQYSLPIIYKLGR